LWDEPHPPSKIPRMPNKILEVKCTNKGHSNMFHLLCLGLEFISF
jgi:hypothetical protein